MLHSCYILRHIHKQPERARDKGIESFVKNINKGSGKGQPTAE